MTSSLGVPVVLSSGTMPYALNSVSVSQQRCACVLMRCKVETEIEVPVDRACGGAVVEQDAAMNPAVMIASRRVTAGLWRHGETGVIVRFHLFDSIWSI